MPKALSRAVRRGLGAALACALLAPGLHAAAPAVPAAPADQSLGIIRGLVYKGDDTTRLMGATVTAINTKTGRRYVSNHTGENGAYEVTGLPAGTYDIAIDVSERVYVTDNLVDLAENQRLYLSWSVQPQGAAPGTPAPKPQAKMTFTDPNAVPPPAAEPAQKKKGFWKSAGGITIISILVGGAVAAGVSAQQN